MSPFFSSLRTSLPSFWELLYSLYLFGTSIGVLFLNIFYRRTAVLLTTWDVSFGGVDFLIMNFEWSIDNSWNILGSSCWDLQCTICCGKYLPRSREYYAGKFFKEWLFPWGWLYWLNWKGCITSLPSLIFPFMLRAPKNYRSLFSVADIPLCFPLD